MEKSLVLLVAGIIPAVVSALPFTLQSSLWKKTADDAAMINYDGRKAWPFLKLKTAEPLKPNTLYRITFEAKCSAPKQIFGGFEPVIQSKKQRLYTQFYPTADFRKYSVYFNSGETPKGTPNIYFNPTSAFQLEVKNIKLDEMTDDFLYGKNLIPLGDFEEGNSLWPYNKKMSDHVKMVDSANFMSGEKSLLLDCPAGENTIAASGFIPAVPGKEIEVKFYAKSEGSARITVWLDWWMSGTKHLYRTFQFKTEKEWKEYSLKYKVSEDVEKNPVLLRKLMTYIQFSCRSLTKGDAKVYLDDIRCTITK